MIRANNTIQVRGRLLDFSVPRVMGILNATPDSFYAGSRKTTEADIAQRAVEIVEQGASIIDVGAFSTRPGAEEVSAEEEANRLRFALGVVRRECPEAIVSVDTYRPAIARQCVEEWGADIINDVSEGGLTGIANVPLGGERGEMFRLVGELRVPYVLMSVKPTLPEMLYAFADEVQQLRDYGARDIILDPGFGFGKDLRQNYALLSQMDRLQVLGLPLLVGVSRKRMAYQLVGGDASTALNATTAIHAVALMKGANLLRVHDVKEAVEAVRVVSETIINQPKP
ncbi:MAG: dihydropteroate synthase [Prevotella sp.]|nr:dihydropteroate synthase [Prevotella sp.]